MRLSRILLVGTGLAAAIALGVTSGGWADDSLTMLGNAPRLPSVPDPALPAGDSSLIVRVEDTPGSGMLIEGAIDAFSIAPPDGSPARRVAPGDVRLRLPGVAAGRYAIGFEQRPCDGNCDTLDAPTMRCTATIDVAAGATTRRFVHQRANQRCAFTKHPAMGMVAGRITSCAGKTSACQEPKYLMIVATPVTGSREADGFTNVGRGAYEMRLAAGDYRLTGDPRGSSCRTRSVHVRAGRTTRANLRCEPT